MRIASHLLIFNIGGGVSACQETMDLPVACNTSQARATLTGFCKSIFDLVASSKSATISSILPFWINSEDFFLYSSGILGMFANPSVKARKYKPVPPTIIGRWFPSSRGVTWRNQSPTEYASLLSTCP